MRFCEVKEHIGNTNISTDIFDMNKIIQRLTLQSEFIEELNYYDSEYISILSDKAKVILYKMYSILDFYMKEQKMLDKI